MKKNNKKIMIIILIILIIVFIIRFTKVLLWTIDSHKTKKQGYDENITLVSDNSNTEIIKQK